MWLLYSLITVALTSILAISFKVVSLKAEDSRAFSFIFNGTILLITLILVLVTGIGKVNLTPWTVCLLVISGIGYGLFQRYQFVVRKHIPTSEIQILVVPTGIAGYLLAIFWLQEAITPVRVMGYALVLLAAILVLFKKGVTFKFNRYIFLTFFIGISLSVAATIDRKVAPLVENVLTYTAILWAAQTIMCYLPYVKIEKIKRELTLQRWKILVLALINLAVLYCQITAIRLAPATKVAPVLASNIVVIALLSIVILKERDRIIIKIIAALLATTGLILVSS